MALWILAVVGVAFGAVALIAASHINERLRNVEVRTDHVHRDLDRAYREADEMRVRLNALYVYLGVELAKEPARATVRKISAVPA